MNVIITYLEAHASELDAIVETFWFVFHQIILDGLHRVHRFASLQSFEVFVETGICDVLVTRISSVFEQTFELVTGPLQFVLFIINMYVSFYA